MGMIRGDLTVLGISNLLQVLSTNHREGYLTLRQGEQKKVLHLTVAGVRLVCGARRINPLGEILIRIGKLTREELKSLLSEQRLTRRPLGELVLRRGILTTAQLENALREQVAEEIYDLFAWPQASFSFVDAQDTRPPVNEGPLSTVVLNCGMMTILLEAARRLDELNEIRSVIPDTDRVVERHEPGVFSDDPELDGDAVREILRRVNGKRSIGEIIDGSVYPKFMVLRTLYDLVVRGAVRIQDRGEALFADTRNPASTAN